MVSKEQYAHLFIFLSVSRFVLFGSHMFVTIIHVKFILLQKNLHYSFKPR